MANEVQISINFRADKNGAGISTNKQFRDDCSGPMISRTQELTSTYELLDLGDVGGPSQVMISNLSTTDNVIISDVGSGSGYLFVGVGKTSIFRPITSTLYAKSDDTSATIQILATEQ